MTMTRDDAGDLVTVQSADRMDRATFCKHMSTRHAEKIADLPGLDPDLLDEYTEACWRAYHRQLHALRLQENVDHDHGVSWG